MPQTDQQKRMYAPIAPLLRESFPDVGDRDIELADEKLLPSTTLLNKDFEANNNNHKKLSFVAQNKHLPHQNMAYEDRIYQHGIIATRNNWHDFFNAMVWKRFVQTKSAINAIHFQETTKQKGPLRSRQRDYLTLFDECGVIIIADEMILSLIKNHQWQDLFVDNKSAWLNGHITAITFGHAMYEKYLQPYIGMTAQTLLLTHQQLNGQTSEISDIDRYLAQRFCEKSLLNNKADLSPLPVLGIPGWYHDQNQTFYDNTDYFRPLRK